MEYSLPTHLLSKCSDLQIHMKVIQNDNHYEKCEIFKTLLEENSYTDVTFTCEKGEIVNCHSSILASVSPMLKSWMKDLILPTNYTIMCPDISAESLRILIRLLYGNLMVLSHSEQLQSLQSLCYRLNISSGVLNQQEFPRSARIAVNNETEESLPMCCWRCGSAFNNLEDLKSHVAKKHLGERIKPTKRHRCTKCKKVLLSMWKLRQHLLTHTINNANVDHQYAEPTKNSRRSSDHPYANAHPPVTTRSSSSIVSSQSITESSSADHPYSFRSSISNPTRGSAKRKATLKTKKSKKIPPAKKITSTNSIHSYAVTSKAKSEIKESHNPVIDEDVQDLVVVNNIIPSSSDSSSGYQCKQCNKRFPQNYRLSRHIKEVHDQVKKFVCNVESCEKAFFKKSSLTRHALTHSNIPTYFCENCLKKFKDPSGLKYHIAKGVCAKRTKAQEENISL